MLACFRLEQKLFVFPFCQQRHIDHHTNGALHYIHTQGILDKFDFLIDGRAKKQIEVFIKKKPKFEEICKELEVCKTTFPRYLIRTLQVYNKYVEKTQEISSLEYFTFVRLDCEKLRKVIQFHWKTKKCKAILILKINQVYLQGLGDVSRKLSNTLLKNVVDTYRGENQAICTAFEVGFDSRSNGGKFG